MVGSGSGIYRDIICGVRIIFGRGVGRRLGSEVSGEVESDDDGEVKL